MIMILLNCVYFELFIEFRHIKVFYCINFRKKLSYLYTKTKTFIIFGIPFQN